MINLQNKAHLEQEIDLDLIELAISQTLSMLGKQSVDLTLCLTNNDELRYLNRKYREIDDVTDVLSFNQDFFNPETERFYLGDIVISIEKAAQQAEENQISVDNECAILAIHGTLHLLGYDHDLQESKNEMWQLQDAIFAYVEKNFKENKNE